ncbi:MAG: 23S rRNA (pseudouridine(1915)-N(3))-methyltransferase RlmH [Candidatus Altiarchaeota archaeon]
MLRLIFIGKTREKFLRNGLSEFLKRLQKFNVEIIEIDDANIEDEAKKILSITKKNFLVVLDVNGKELSSEEFAKFIKENLYDKEIYFVVGSHHGVPDELLKRANFKISLSRMTFTHELARLILIEQIYRAFMIIQGRKYHR